MFCFYGRPCARSLAVLFAAASFANAIYAEDGSWTLAEVQRRAVEHQPLLEIESAQVEAARQRAVSARQLPDPQLKLGVLGLPADTHDAWRFNRDSFTMSSVGVVQDFPLAGKRRLKGESESLQADAGDAKLAAATLAVQRDAGLAYLALLHPHHALALVQQQIVEAQRSLDAALIAYRAGQRAQSDVLAARAAIGMLQDRAADFQQEYAVARENLRRWIGDVPEATPDEPSGLNIPPLGDLLASLARHPELVAADRAVDHAEVESRLAKKSKQPDFNVELDYGYRTGFSDLVSLQVGIPLTLFTRDRQDRDIAAALSDRDSQQAMREDLRRRLAAEISADYREWEALGPRIHGSEQNIIAPMTGRINASLAEYRSGTGPFTAVLEARQALLDAELSLLALRLQRLQLALKLRYFASES